jgi:hypothetical protein
MTFFLISAAFVAIALVLLARPSRSWSPRRNGPKNPPKGPSCVPVTPKSRNAKR